MTPDVAKIIATTFITELEIAKAKFKEAQTTFQAASDVLEATSIRMNSIENIRDSLLQFPDILQAFKALSISPS